MPGQHLRRRGGHRRLGHGGGDIAVCGLGPRNFACGDGSGGDDQLFGTTGADEFTFRRGDARRPEQAVRGGGDVRAAGGNGAGDRLVGHAEGMFGTSQGGNDALYGGGRMFGDAVALLDHPRGGDDLLVNTSDGGAQMRRDAQRANGQPGAAMRGDDAM